MRLLKIPSISCILFLVIFVFACKGMNPKESGSSKVKEPLANQLVTTENYVRKSAHGFYSGFLDSKGMLWFASRGDGVYRYDGNSFTHFTEKDGLSDNDISCIMEDQDGNLWFGTADGLCRFDRKVFSHLAIPFSDTSSFWLDKVYPIVNPNQVMSILEDPRGDLWIGTNGAGVYQYDGNTFTQHLENVGKFYEDSLQHNIVLSITEDLLGNIWFTSLSHAGVSRFDGTTFTHFKTEDGLSDNFVRTSFCDRVGNIWIGTHGVRNGGLDKFDGKTFTNFHKTEDGIFHNNVSWIYEDKSGDLWLGSGVTKLTIFDGKHFKEFTSKDGERFDKIIFIVEDAKGNIWFGNRDGLWRFDGEVITDMVQN